MAKKKELPKEKPKETPRFLPKTSPRGQLIGNRPFKTLASKVRFTWNGNDL
jgi:hypothetical protein